MELLSGILISSYQGLMLFIISKVILNFKYTPKEKMTIGFITIISGLIYIVLNRFTLFIIILIDTIYLYRKTKLYSILTMVGSVLIIYLGNLSAISSFLILDQEKTNIIIVYAVYLFLFTVTSLILAYLVRFIIQKLKKSYLSTNKLYLSVVSIFLASIFISLFTFMPKNISTFKNLQLMVILYISFILAVVVLVLVISFTVLREMKYKRQVEEIENYYKYTLRIEKINNDMRKFRHDYVNILLSMSEFIRDDDMPGLRAYFEEHIVPLKDNMQTNSFKINGLERLQIRELKGLLTTKIIQAQENNIRVSVEVPDEIHHISLDMIDLSRVMGIILDNAIEASTEIDDPLIQIGFMKNKDAVMIIVMNKCAKDIPKVHELFKENFSTKGPNRGLGLSTLREIIDQTDNVLLDTVIENHYFIQKLEIMNTEHEDVK
ncbi:GHKL domain-containing protein [Staphylococcus simulans]|nr:MULTISPECIES: GHKL domain-containing protein [Staphylococcus]OFM15167.1 histidine kinase [Staphylococcus sp. HMSC059E03]OFN19064.1 histidine kinase [Staphylococcus sp. HMSC055C03]OFU77120.1 histidine kinase [Staphylococcus sp. HMSC10C03]OFV03939.1 histidine kinase [Staphylococcus sp. HMSC12H08]OHR53013.1 histidine kinase [Staphylococcus sp. HMSC061G12]